MGKRFPVGSRVGGIMTDGEVPLKVLGHHHDDTVIVEVLADYPEPEGGLRHGKGDVFVASAINLIEREEVKHTPGEAEDDNGPAIGWIDLGGLSVGLTRDSGGTLQVTLDSDGKRVQVRVSQGISNNLWEGDIK